MKVEKSMIKRGLILMVFALSVLGVKAQEGVRSQWIGELGLHNGVTYEQRLSNKFMMRYSAGVMANWRLQPYGIDGFEVASEYTGLAPTIGVGLRWFPSVKPNNSGFFVGLNLKYVHSDWSFAVDRRKLKYHLQHELYLMPSVGYLHQISDRLNVKAELLPTGEISARREDAEMYIGLNLRGDIGITYRF